LDHDYTTKEVFNKNFFKDWRKVMTEKEKDVIRYGVLTFLHYYI
jgi:DNA topoisomerase-1